MLGLQSISFIANAIILFWGVLAMVTLDLLVAGVMAICRFPFRKVFLKGLWVIPIPFLGWSYGHFVERNQIRVERVVIESRTLPSSFNGYRVVQISDLHLHSFRNRGSVLQKAVDSVNALRPDLIVFTGDLITFKPDELEGFEGILSQLHAKDGVFSIFGNHDYGTYYPWKSQRERLEAVEALKRREQAMQWRLLLDEQHPIPRGTDTLSLIGVENISALRHFTSVGNLQKAMTGATGAFKLLLSHDPTHWEAVCNDTDIDLMLAGHTHGFQISFFGWSPASLLFKQYSGLYSKGKQYLYVNIGLGETGMDARVGAVPEITLIELHSQK